MGSYLASPLEFLITSLFSLYILAVMLRFLLQRVRADFYNPLSQAIVKVTNPPLRPLRRMIPGFAGIDIASLVLMLALQMVSLYLVVLLRGDGLSFIPLLIRSFAELVGMAFNVFIFSILIQALLSWVNPGTYNPVSSILYSLNEPLLRPARNLIPPAGMLDLSPLAVLLGLQVLKMLVMPLLFGLAAGLG